jgi:multidrug resistance efflux pump
VTVAILLVAVLLLLIVLAIWRLPPFSASGLHTDNAYVRGRSTTIAPEVAGYVERVLVRDYAVVRRGDLLVKIDDSTYAARVAQARADLATRRSDLANNVQAQASARATLRAREAALAGAEAKRVQAAADLRRAEALVGDGSVSVRERDAALAAARSADATVAQARADVGVARQDVRSQEVAAGGLSAQVEQARAALRSAEIDLGRTRIVAPVDGQLGPVDTHEGRFVASGTTLFTLIPPERWIIADYKERQTHAVRVGQSASFTVDALDGQRFHGIVERIAPATGSEFAAIKPDNGTGNFVKVPQRIGVRIGIPRDQPLFRRLRPGMSVEMSIDTVSAVGEEAPAPRDDGQGGSR